MSTHTSLVSTGIQFPDGTTQTTRATGEFSSGVVMVFYQASAPTGWTKSTSHNNKALRVVSSTGGGSGGSWNLSSGVTSSSTGSHTHTFSDSSSTTSSNGSHAHSTSSHTLSSSRLSLSSPNPTSVMAEAWLSSLCTLKLSAECASNND